MEIKTARNWYWWLWLSPLVTIPTLLLLAISGIEYLFEPLVGYIFSHAILVLLSGLWHLILLVPALNKTSPFIGWHGRQALILAGIRTAVPISMVLLTQDEYGVLYAIPILLIIWFFGTLWGQLQAIRGECSLMRWFGREDLLPSPEPSSEFPPDPVQELDRDPDSLVEIIRFSHDPHQRSAALRELKKLGFVEELGGEAITEPVSTPLPKTKDGPPVEKRGGGYIWLILVGVLAVLWIANRASSIYRDYSVTAAHGTATSIASMNATATAQAMQSVIETASRWPHVLQDNFYSIQGNWDIGYEENKSFSGTRQISNGSYTWDAQAKEGFIWWSIPETDRMFFDFFLTVELKQLSGPADSWYGVVFRYIDEDNHYYFRIRDDKYLYIGSRYEGDWVMLDQWTIPSAISPGGFNRLTVIAEGSNIILFINNKYIGGFKDSQFGVGDAGLMISLDAGDEAQFSFDNFELRAPVLEAGEQNKWTANKLVDAGAILARQGNIEEAFSYYAEAQAIDPELEIPANSWNALCWFGSLWGYAAEVMEACETAVALDPEHGGIRDSRGVARALLGDFTGAIEDFNFYIEWAIENNTFWHYGQKRDAWITELEKGRNPFDTEMLESLKQE